MSILSDLFPLLFYSSRGCYDDWDRDSNDGEGETDEEEEDMGCDGLRRVATASHFTREKSGVRWRTSCVCCKVIKVSQGGTCGSVSASVMSCQLCRKFHCAIDVSSS